MGQTMQIFLARQGQSFGPFSESEILDSWRACRIDVGDSIWHEGLQAWTPAAAFCLALERTSQSNSEALNNSHSRQGGNPSGFRGNDELIDDQRLLNKRSLETKISNEPPEQGALPDAIILQSEAIKPKTSKAINPIFFVLPGIVMLWFLFRALIPGVSSLSTSVSERKMIDAIGEASAFKISAAEFYQSTGRLPHNLVELGFGTTTSGANFDELQIDDGTILIHFYSRDGRERRTLALEPILFAQSQLSWRCGFAAMAGEAEQISNIQSHVATTFSSTDLPAACR